MPTPALPSSPRQALVEAAQRATGLPDPKVERLRRRPMHWEVLEPSQRSLERVDAVAVAAGVRVPFSAVVKTLTQQPREAAHPQDWNFWRREADAYASGLLSSIVGLRAPGVLALTREGTRRLCLWMEDVPAKTGPWTDADYGAAAFALGQFNGAFVQCPPTAPYVCRDWLGQAIRTHRGALLHGATDNPAGFGPFLINALRTIAEESETALHQLKSLPQTLNHFDASSDNLLRHLDGQAPVAVDWAFLGTGALGVDLGHLLSSEVLWRTVTLARAQRLIPPLLDAYLRGVRTFRKRVDVQGICFAAQTACRLRCAAVSPWLSSLLTFPQGRRLLQRRWGAPLSRSVRAWVRGLSWLAQDDVFGAN